MAATGSLATYRRCGCGAWGPYEVWRDQVGQTVDIYCLAHLPAGFRALLDHLHPDKVHTTDQPCAEVRHADPLRNLALTFAPTPRGV